MAIHNAYSSMGVGSITAAQISTANVSGIAASAYVNTIAQTPVSIDPDGKIKATSLELDGVDIGLTLAKIQERLAILVPDPKRLEKYEALQELYTQYKMMEALLLEDDK